MRRKEKKDEEMSGDEKKEKTKPPRF